MAGKYNNLKASTKPLVKSPVTTTGRTQTALGASGYTRSDESDLYLLSVSGVIDKSTFHEEGVAREERYIDLLRRVALANPPFVTGMMPWLRTSGYMRSASVMGAAEAAKVLCDAHRYDGVEDMVNGSLQRADEVGEFIAYWYSIAGKGWPKRYLPVKKALKKAASRLYTEHCVRPDTLVLARSMDWVKAGTLRPGDELVGFDEDLNPGRGKSSNLRVSVVEKAGRATLRTLRVTTDKGQTDVSSEHQFVVIGKWGHRAWKTADALEVGDTLVWFGEPWSRDASYDEGWMAGFLDGEGYITGGGTRNNAAGIAFAQNLGDTLEYAKATLKRLGFEIRVQEYEAKGNAGAKEIVRVANGRYHSMKLLGMTKPVRFDSDRLWVDRNIVSKGSSTNKGNAHTVVTCIEELGMQENVTLATSTKTFIGDGYLCHNSYGKYDSPKRAYRFADVIGLVHPAPTDDSQSALFKLLLDRRRGTTDSDTSALPMLSSAATWHRMASEDPTNPLLLEPSLIKGAGLTWEHMLSALGKHRTRAELWEAVIPNMGVNALLKNLRNFDEAGISRKTADKVAAALCDPKRVRGGKVFPYSFLVAHRHTHSLRWGQALEDGLAASLENVPQLKGHTLFLVDRSPSMFPGQHFSTPHKGEIPLADKAAVFGAALALRAEKATLVEFGGATNFWGSGGIGSRRIDVRKGASVLKTVDSFGETISGTDIPRAVKDNFLLHEHNRVVIITDEQSQPGMLPSNMFHNGGCKETAIDDLIPKSTPVYLWNIAGYTASILDSAKPNRHSFGGLSDASFGLLDLVEQGRNTTWPWL